MSDKVLFLLVASEMISSILIVFIWRRSGPTSLKIIASLVALVPVIGPIFYFFVEDNTPIHRNHLGKNDLPRGEYTQRWIFIRSVFNRKDRKYHSREGEEDDEQYKK